MHVQSNRTRTRVHLYCTRSISVTSVVGKIMEEIIRDTITVHMKENELLSKCQFGFVKGRSTVPTSTIKGIRYMD